MRHSRPAQFRATVAATSASQGSPAAAVTRPPSSKRTPRVAMFSHQPLHSGVGDDDVRPTAEDHQGSPRAPAHASACATIAIVGGAHEIPGAAPQVEGGQRRERDIGFDQQGRDRATDIVHARPRRYGQYVLFSVGRPAAQAVSPRAVMA